MLHETLVGRSAPFEYIIRKLKTNKHPKDFTMSSLNPGSCLGVLLCSLKAVLFEWEMKVPNNCTIGWFSRGGQGEAESYQFLMHAASISETRNPKFLKIRYGVYFWADLEFFFGGGLFLQILFWSPYRVHKIQVFWITVTEYWSLRNAMYNNKKSNSRVIFIAFNICNIRSDIHLHICRHIFQC